MYTATITKIKTKKHPNADKIQLGIVLGTQVVIGLDVKDGDLGIFFPSDGQLSLEYCEANNLFPVFDASGKRVGGGFFSLKRRVKSQSFRGEKSDGYWAPINSLEFTGDTSSLKEGDNITEFNNIPICNKYVTPSTSKQQVQNRKRINDLFYKHADTDHLVKDIGKIEDGSVFTITEKLHGTSQRISYIPDKNNLSFFDRLKKFIKKEDINSYEYKKLYGSRNVILDETKSDHYYKDDFRFKLYNTIKDKLNKNEIIYGEIVGYTLSGKEIMPHVSINKIKDRDTKNNLKSIFGDTIFYNYGCNPDSKIFDFYVYRIAVVNPDGILTEMSWPQVKKRCLEMGIKYVPEITHDLKFNNVYQKSFEKEFLEHVSNIINNNISSTVSKTTLCEGVVVRFDQPNGDTVWLKEKSFLFKVLEGIVKEDDSYVDMEEVS